jgi:hypothetical protein
MPLSGFCGNEWLDGRNVMNKDYIPRIPPSLQATWLGQENTVRVEFRNAKITNTVEGLLLPGNWDEGGTVTAVVLCTSLEKEYLIHKDPMGDELVAFLRKRAKISGQVNIDHQGTRSITVEAYEILEE